MTTPQIQLLEAAKAAQQYLMSIDGLVLEGDDEEQEVASHIIQVRLQNAIAAYEEEVQRERS